MVTKGQLHRFLQRYHWAGQHARGKITLELACGTGPGLGYLHENARRLVAGDISERVLAIARLQYGDRIDIRRLDACDTKLEANGFEVIIFFEAIYYLADLERFFAEMVRLLRPGGKLLIATSNKDLFDFNPSPFSTTYLNPPELDMLLKRHGFDCKFYGGSPVPSVNIRSRFVRLIKRFASKNKLIPDSMSGKRLIKRFIYGPLVAMPKELNAEGVVYTPPIPIRATESDVCHQVLYCEATKK